MSLTSWRTRRGRTAAVVAAVTLGLSALTITPAVAADAVFNVGGDSGATAQVNDLAYSGSPIHIEGTGWTTGITGSNGSCVAVKLGNGSGASGASGALATVQDPLPTPAGPCTGVIATNLGVWALVPADEDGKISADLPFPTASNSGSPKIVDSEWAAGTKHHLRLLSGATNGGTVRSAYIDFTIAAPASTPTIATPTVTVSGGNVYASLSGSGFTGGETLTAKLGDTALSFGTGTGTASTTVPATGVFSGVRLNLPSGTRAGKYTVTIQRSADGADDYPLSLTVNPTLAWSNGARVGSSGTLTLSNLADGATISSVKLGDSTIATDLTANSDGVATASYSIPSDFAVGATSLTVAQTAPSAVGYTVNVTVYPDETIFGTDGFDLISDGNGFTTNPGLYQSAYSAKKRALYVTAASQGTGTSGFLYRLDPDTLDVVQSVNLPAITKDAAGNDVSGIGAGFGVGVDDVHGTVWITLSGRSFNTVAVYRQSDLKLLKQLPTGTTSHARDVVYDPESNLVFASSASEGTSGDGYISVFSPTAPYNKLTDIQTGPRTEFNPVSLALGGGLLYSPSLQSNQVVRIDTAKVKQAIDKDEAYTPTFLKVGSYLGSGRGSSGIAYDAKHNRVFVASQNQNSVTVADGTTGEVIKEVATGQQALNAVVDPVHELVYVTNFGGSSVSVLDTDGNKVAALPITRANHVAVDDQGDAFVVDKNAASGTTNKVWKITPRAVAAGSVSIEGAATIGETLRAVATGWDPEATLTYQWKRYGQRIDGATSASYRLTSADVGKRISVAVTGTRKDYQPTTVTSARTAAVVKTGQPAGTVAITGTARVGQKVAASTAGWASGSKLSYQWKRAGVAIGSATGATYQPVVADLGKALTVTVTGTLADHEDATATSAAVTVAPGILTAPTPKISGTAKVGKKLTATAGKWTSGTKLSYRWYASGSSIKGATSSSFKLTSKQKGKKITVKVTGTLTGYATVTKTSKATKKVAR